MTDAYLSTCRAVDLPRESSGDTGISTGPATDSLGSSGAANHASAMPTKGLARLDQCIAELAAQMAERTQEEK